MYRIILLEHERGGEVSLLQLVEQNWTTAQNVMDALRRTVAERGSQVLYAAILNAPGASKGCCRETGAKILV